jgi:hypothetical protein
MQMKGNFVKTFMTEPKTTQMYATQQTHGDGHHGQAAPMPTHDEIAKRAYDIYVKKGRRQGQCERNWQQAENDLSTERKDTCAAAPQRGICQSSRK